MKDYSKRILVAFVLVLPIGLRAGLTEKIDGIISQRSERKVQFSIYILDAATGRTVYSRNAARPVMPASNMKIVTSAAALRYLGGNYEFKTRVALVGKDLVIIGSGDPLLADRATDEKYNRPPGWIFEDIAACLHDNGINRIRNIIVDDGVFDRQLVHPSWPKEQLNQWYACEVAGVNFNGNCLDITVANQNGRITISTQPQTSYVTITNNIRPTSKKDEAVGSYRGKNPNEIVLFGKCGRQEGPFSVAIQEPAAFFGYVLAEHLAAKGIDIDGQVRLQTAQRTSEFRLLKEYGTPIADCLARCNKNSFGLAAEAMLKAVAARARPDRRGGSWQQGRELVSFYLRGLGIEPDEFYIDDGSGLSRANRLSARAITRVLLDMYTGPNWKLYAGSLAVGGQEGTIGKYFREDEYRGKVLGKTGYIAGVKALSGLCNTEKGDYIFSILANNAGGQTRDVINNIAKAIIDNANGKNVAAKR